MAEEQNLQIFRKALDNEKYFGGENAASKGRKVLLYYCALILLNRRCQLQPGKIHIINGSMELKFVGETNYETVFYGSFSQDFLERLRKDRTVVSTFSRWKRLRLLCRATAQSLFAKKGQKNLGYWIDFTFWDAFLKQGNTEQLLSNGHFDRLTTMLSLLCEKHGIRFEMQQHGVISFSQKIPHKLYCDKMYCYDSVEMEKFRQNIIASSHCEYEKKFAGTIQFAHTDHEGIRIGYVDQPVPENCEVLERIVKVFPDQQVVVMLHPHSDVKKYAAFQNNPNIEITYDKKEWNVELLVSLPSTLTYQYIFHGFQQQILYVDVHRSLPEMGENYENIIYVSTLDQAESALLQWKQGRRIL